MKSKIMILVLALVLTGCCAKVQPTVCPPFPSPTNEALDKIESLHSTPVDDWIVRLFKLKQQLELCNTPK